MACRPHGSGPTGHIPLLTPDAAVCPAPHPRSPRKLSGFLTSSCRVLDMELWIPVLGVVVGDDWVFCCPCVSGGMLLPAWPRPCWSLRGPWRMSSPRATPQRLFRCWLHPCYNLLELACSCMPGVPSASRRQGSHHSFIHSLVHLPTGVDGTLRAYVGHRHKGTDIPLRGQGGQVVASGVTPGPSVPLRCYLWTCP